MIQNKQALKLYAEYGGFGNKQADYQAIYQSKFKNPNFINDLEKAINYNDYQSIVNLIKNEEAYGMNTDFKQLHKILTNININIPKNDVIVFTKVKEIILVWSEASDAANEKFTNLDELHNFIKKEYKNNEAKIPTAGYDKHKIAIKASNENDTETISLSICGGMGRVDVSVTRGDFNPFKEHLNDYIQRDYLDKSIKKSEEGTEYIINIDFSNSTTYDKNILKDKQLINDEHDDSSFER